MKKYQSLFRILWTVILTLINIGIAQSQDFSTNIQCDMAVGYSDSCLISWSPNGEWIATTSKTVEKVDIWNAEEQTLIQSLPAHADTLTWNREGNILATVTEYTIQLWDVEEAVELNAFDLEDIFFQERLQGSRVAFPSVFTSIDWNVSTDQIAIVANDWVGIWGQHQDSFMVLNFLPDYDSNHNTPISAKWDPTGRYLAVVFGAGEIMLYNSVTLELVVSFKKNSLTLPAYKGQQIVTWSSDGQYLAIVGYEQLSAHTSDSTFIIDIFDPFSGELITTLNGHKNLLSALAWSSNRNFLASSGSDHYLGDSPDNTIKIWNTNTFTMIDEYKFDNPITSLSISPDDKQLVAIDLYGTAYLIDISPLQ